MLMDVGCWVRLSFERFSSKCQTFHVSHVNPFGVLRVDSNCCASGIYWERWPQDCMRFP